MDAKRTTRLVVICAAALLAAPARAGGAAGGEGEPRHSVDFSPVSPIVNIWGAQYAYAVTPRDELVTGLAYMNIQYDFGRSHAPTLSIGYRRYLWRTLHVEYLLMPSYNWFWSSDERRTYRSFELWNEARVGYRLDFHAGRVPLYVNVQWLLGVGLYGGSKPESFERQARREPVFTAPMLFTGVRF